MSLGGLGGGFQTTVLKWVCKFLPLMEFKNWNSYKCIHEFEWFGSSFLLVYIVCVVSFIIVSLILKENKGDVSEIAVLMSLLLFDEIARMEIWWVYFLSLFGFSCLTNKCTVTQYLVVLPVLFHIRSDKSSKDVTLAPFSLPLSLIRRWTLFAGSRSSLRCSALWTVCTSDIVSQVSHPIPGSEPSCCQPLLLHPGPLLWPPDPGTHPPGPAGCLEHCMAFWDRKPPRKSEWSLDQCRVSTSVFDTAARGGAEHQLPLWLYWCISCFLLCMVFRTYIFVGFRIKAGETGQKKNSATKRKTLLPFFLLNNRPFSKTAAKNDFQRLDNVLCHLSLFTSNVT